ncbi:hypothetical protein OPT61_g1625 [Boeremia exigua]|uniref:Uncharacterized protein n=1 Tax=Boeremia exigua TaxID=749465 RepID=A0ACC2IPN6_9PLEO|nr:hypothetical protein OPT61_g1625 [Boeremia exigua]
MPQQQHNVNALKEAQVQLALQALKQDANLSQRRAAAIYRVPQSTLSHQRTGRPSRGDTMPNSRGLDNNEEQVIVEHILELDARGFGPRLADVAAMANSLRAERNLGPVGTNWPSQISTGAVVTALERQGRLKTVQPGNWEWVTVIQGINAKGWAIPPFIIFKARHHLTGWYKEEDLPQDWVIGVSSNGWTTNELGLEWLKHFDRHTKERTVGTHRLLVINGHESHDSLQFQQYCKDNKIVTLCMPAHLSHLLQPLNSEFLPCFVRAYNAAIIPSNIQGGFRGAGLAPFDPERVIMALDVKLRTPSPQLPTNNEPWQSQTPSNTLEFGSQSTLIQEKYKKQQGSSPNSVLSALEHYAKGGAILSHKLVLAQQQIAELQAANEAATRRKSHKRKRVQKEGTLIVEDGQRLAALKEFGARGDGKRAKKQVRAQEGEPAQRRCGRCNQTGHNTRTCKINVEEVSK